MLRQGARFQYFLKTWFNQTFCRHGITGREKEKSEWCDKHCHSTKKKNDGKQQGKAIRVIARATDVLKITENRI